MDAARDAIVCTRVHEPRHEIAAEVADRGLTISTRCNGVSVRMAVLYLLLGGSEAAFGTSETETGA